ncbi:unnamed protein product [Prunus armeniaca]
MDPNRSLHLQEAEEAEGETTLLLTMTEAGRGQTRGIIQIWKSRKNTGRKLCPDHAGWIPGLITLSQNRGEISTLSML